MDRNSKHHVHVDRSDLTTVQEIESIVAHYGPLSRDHPAYMGSMYNLLLQVGRLDHDKDTEEEKDHRTCKYITRGLNQVLHSTSDINLAKVIQYSIDRHLLSNRNWTSQLPKHIRLQLPQVLYLARSSSSLQEDRHDDVKHCQAITRALKASWSVLLVRNHDDKNDDSCRSLREGVCELFLDADASTSSKLYESLVNGQPQFFRNCFSWRFPKLRRKKEASIRSIPNQQPAQDGMVTMRMGEAPTPCVGTGNDSASSERCDRKSEEDTVDTDDVSLAQLSIATLKSYAVRTVTQSSGHLDALSKDGTFGNFSLLVSRSKTPMQFRHVDTHNYEKQYGMVISADSPGTETYIVLDPLETPDDAVRLWTSTMMEISTATAGVMRSERRKRKNRNHAIDPTHVGEKLAQAMWADDTIVFWIRHYGKILARPHRMIRAAGGPDDGLWKAGTVVSIPGGVVHGAPRNGAFRVVLFFTYTPKGQPSYCANDQFTGPTLTASIAYRLWDKVGESEKELLRRVLRQSVLEDPCRDVDFSCYLQREIGAEHEIGEILREAYEHNLERKKRRTRILCEPSSVLNGHPS